MSTYLTETTREGKRWAGPDIKARYWEEAESRAKELGVKLVGEWMMSITAVDGVGTDALADMIIQERNEGREVKAETIQ